MLLFISENHSGNFSPSSLIRHVAKREEVQQEEENGDFVHLFLLIFLCYINILWNLLREEAATKIGYLLSFVI